LLHELGHSIVAQSFGIRVLDITFWPLGGMARMSQIPENSRIEGLIAIAGPAVNFVLAGASLTFLLLPGIAGSAVGDLALVFLLFNVALGGFNLIPAFPMDGGRVLRAILGRKGDWVRATEGAVRVGRFFALLMFLSFFVTWNPVLPLIALFVWWTGQQELLAVRLRHATAGFGPFGPFGAFGNFAGGPARP
ncbi:MAG: site-2 protease family protein, partial [Anaerolineales bacterium]|nr:site-2 protease family protein [Anaerolineales bacterium]